MSSDAMKLQALHYLATRLGVNYQRAADLVRHDFFPQGVVIRLGRQIRINPSALDDFISGGGKPLPGGWRREA